MKDRRPVHLLISVICLLAALQPAGAQQAQSPAPTPVPKHPQSAAPPKSGFTAVLSTGPLFTQPRPAVDAANAARQATIRRGEALMKSGDADGAIGSFQQALTMEPYDGLARQRLAEAYTAKGQTVQALAAYRDLLHPAVPGRRWVNSQESDPTVLMHFALLLLQTGQAQEALTAYHRAVSILDAAGGEAHSLGVDLPYLGDGPGQVPYTPQMLEAMAHLALGVTSNELGTWAAESKIAADLAPDSAAAQFYLGKSLLAVGRNREARAAFSKAVQLGDEQTAKEANVYLKMAR